MVHARPAAFGSTIVIVAAILGGCGGGGGANLAPNPPGAPVSLPTTTPLSGRTATLTLTIPRNPDAAQRSPRYVPPNTTAIRITVKSVNGLAPTGTQVPQNPSTVTLTTGQGGNCTVVSAVETCTVTIPAPTGAVVYQFDLLDVNGNTLATNTVTLQIASGANNPTFAVQLDAQAGGSGCPNPSIAILSLPAGASGTECSGASFGTIVLNSASAQTFSVAIKDGGGATIAAGSAGAPTLGATQTGGIVSVSVSQNPYSVTLTPVKPGPGTLTLTANGANAGDGTIAQSTTFAIDYPAWTTKASLPAHHSAIGAGVINGLVYGVGSGSLDAYNPATDSWATKAPMAVQRFGVGVGVANNILYAFGGADNLEDQSNLQAYDPLSNTWTSKASMPSARSEMGVGVINNVLYAVGSVSIPLYGMDAQHFDSNQAYDPSSNSWTPKASMPTARNCLAVGVVNNILYAVGGTGTAGVLNVVEAYDPSTNTWTTKAPMPTARTCPSVAVMNNILYAVGGQDRFDSLSVLEAYDPSTNTWTAKPPMPTARAAVGAATLNNTLYAIGGFSSGTLTTVEAFTP